jgi:surface-adhesin protein E
MPPFVRHLAPAPALLLLFVLWPATATAQRVWTGVGAMGGTAMFMDTASIERSGTLRTVWIRSVDSSPRTFVAGKDTLTFDSVTGLNIFDCSSGTRTVSAVQYLLGGETVLSIPVTHEKPEALRPKSFFAAIYNDLCRAAPAR